MSKTDSDFNEKYSEAYHEGYKQCANDLEEVIQSIIFDNNWQSTLQKAANLTCYEPLIDQLNMRGLISDERSVEIFKRLRQGKAKSLSLFDPEIECETGDRIQGGEEKLFSWS